MSKTKIICSTVGAFAGTAASSVVATAAFVNPGSAAPFLVLSALVAGGAVLCGLLAAREYRDYFRARAHESARAYVREKLAYREQEPEPEHALPLDADAAAADLIATVRLIAEQAAEALSQSLAFRSKMEGLSALHSEMENDRVGLRAHVERAEQAFALWSGDVPVPVPPRTRPVDFAHPAVRAALERDLAARPTIVPASPSEPTDLDALQRVIDEGELGARRLSGAPAASGGR